MSTVKQSLSNVVAQHTERDNSGGEIAAMMNLVSRKLEELDKLVDDLKVKIEPVLNGGVLNEPGTDADDCHVETMLGVSIYEQYRCIYSVCERIKTIMKAVEL